MKFIAAIKNKNEDKLKFQGKSARSQRGFDIDFDWVKISFSTHGPDLYRIFFKSHGDTQYTSTFKSFQVPKGNSKFVEMFKFYNDAPMLKYVHKLLNIYCFRSLASAFASIEKTKDADAISLNH